MTRLTAFFDGLSAWAARLPPRGTNRGVGLMLALPSTVVLGIAAWLTPSPHGYGTHTQLGLGSCLMLTLTGWPCPMCGMTTTFSLLAHLRFLDALKNQPFGIVLFSLTVLAAGIGWVDLLTGHGLFRRALKAVARREQVLALGLLAGMILGWLYKGVVLHPALFGGAS